TWAKELENSIYTAKCFYTKNIFTKFDSGKTPEEEQNKNAIHSVCSIVRTPSPIDLVIFHNAMKRQLPHLYLTCLNQMISTLITMP
ncbi:hypothetical protein PFISCL1PPCAC_18850, partial [Pristionchus fissidentatus]